MLSQFSRRFYTKAPRSLELTESYLQNMKQFQSNALLRSEFPKGTPDHAIELWTQWPENVPAPGQEINKEYLDKKYPAPKPKFQLWGGLVGFPMTDPVKFRYQMLTHFEEKSRFYTEYFVKSGHKDDYNVLGGDKKWQYAKQLSIASMFLAFAFFIPVFISLSVFNRTFFYQNVIKGGPLDVHPKDPYRKVRRDETGRFYIGQ